MTIFERYSEQKRKELGELLDGMGKKLDTYDSSYTRIITEPEVYGYYDRRKSEEDGYHLREDHIEYIKDPESTMRPNDPDVLIHMLTIPLEEVPLYSSSINELAQILIKWRMRQGC
jgi:hypothetical protein